MIEKSLLRQEFRCYQPLPNDPQSPQCFLAGTQLTSRGSQVRNLHRPPTSRNALFKWLTKLCQHPHREQVHAEQRLSSCDDPYPADRFEAIFAMTTANPHAIVFVVDVLMLDSSLVNT